MTIVERARIWAEKQVQEHHDYPSMSGRVRKAWTKSYMQDYMSIATEQKEIDIEQIPQLYVRWLMIDGEKPTWKEYAIKALEEWI